MNSSAPSLSHGNSANMSELSNRSPNQQHPGNGAASARGAASEPDIAAIDRLKFVRVQLPTTAIVPYAGGRRDDATPRNNNEQESEAKFIWWPAVVYRNNDELQGFVKDPNVKSKIARESLARRTAQRMERTRRRMGCTAVAYLFGTNTPSELRTVPICDARMQTMKLYENMDRMCDMFEENDDWYDAVEDAVEFVNKPASSFSARSGDGGRTSLMGPDNGNRLSLGVNGNGGMWTAVHPPPPNVMGACAATATNTVPSAAPVATSPVDYPRQVPEITNEAAVVRPLRHPCVQMQRPPKASLDIKSVSDASSFATALQRSPAELQQQQQEDSAQLKVAQDRNGTVVAVPPDDKHGRPQDRLQRASRVICGSVTSVDEKKVNNSNSNTALSHVLRPRIHRNDTWPDVYKKLKNIGWSHGKGSGLVEWVYKTPDYKKYSWQELHEKGTKGVSFFYTEEEVKAFVRREYSWVGPEERPREVVVTQSKPGRHTAVAEAVASPAGRDSVDSSLSGHTSAFDSHTTNRDNDDDKEEEAVTEYELVNDASTSSDEDSADASVFDRIYDAKLSDLSPKYATHIKKARAKKAGGKKANAKKAAAATRKTNANNNKNKAMKKKGHPAKAKQGRPPKHPKLSKSTIKAGKKPTAKQNPVKAAAAKNTPTKLYGPGKAEAASATKATPQVPTTVYGPGKAVAFADAKPQSHPTVVTTSSTMSTLSLSSASSISTNDDMTIPDFKNAIWPTLKQYFGFVQTRKNKFICLPKRDPMHKKTVLGRDYFKTPEDLQKHLLAYGVPEPVEENKWPSRNKLEQIDIWVRLAYCSTLINKTVVPNTGGLSARQAWSLLLKIGFGYKGGMYYTPSGMLKDKGAKEGVDYFDGHARDLYLTRFGLPLNSNFNNISEKDRMALELFYAFSDSVDTLTRNEPTDDDPLMMTPTDELDKSAASDPVVDEPKSKEYCSGNGRRRTTVLPSTPSDSSASSSSTETDAPIPISDFHKTILPVLQRSFGIKYKGDKYCLPNINPKDENAILGRNYFDSVLSLRKHLCAYGLPKETKSVSEEAKEGIRTWVRIANIPSLRQRKEVPVPTKKLSSKEAWSLLCKLGFRYSSGKYCLPGVSLKDRKKVKEGRDYFTDGTHWRYLSRFGIPPNADCGQITEEQRMNLDLFIAAAEDIDTFTQIEPSDDDPVTRNKQKEGEGRRKAPKPNPVLADAGAVMHESAVVPTAVKESAISEEDNCHNAHKSSADAACKDVADAGSIDARNSTSEKKTDEFTSAVVNATINEAPKQSKKDHKNHTTSRKSDVSTAGSPKKLTNSKCVTAPASKLSPMASSPVIKRSLRFTSSDESAATSEDETSTDCKLLEASAFQDSTGDSTNANTVDAPATASMLLTQPPEPEPEGKDEDQSESSHDALARVLGDEVSIQLSRGSEMSEKVGSLQDHVSEVDREFADGGAEVEEESHERIVDSVPHECGGKDHKQMENATASKLREQQDDSSNGKASMSSSTHTAAASTLGGPAQAKSQAPMTPTRPQLSPASTSKSACSPQILRAKECMKNIEGSPVVGEKGPKIKGTPVQKSDNWVNVKEKMLYSGWQYLKGTGLIEWYYILPGGKKPKAGGIRGEDYLESEYEMKKFAFDNFGWGGDEAFHAESKSRKRPRKEANPVVDEIVNGKVVRKENKKSNIKEQLNPKKRGASDRPPLAPKKPRNASIAPPEKKTTVLDKLKCCLEVLKPSYQSTGLAAVDEANGDSRGRRLSDRIKSVNGFLQSVVRTYGSFGSSSSSQMPASIHVCGNPGTGKTTAVKKCCEEMTQWAPKLMKDQLLTYCFVNCAHIQWAQSEDILKTIFNSLGMKSEKDDLNYLREIENAVCYERQTIKRLVVLVLDEIDLLLSAKGKNDGGEKLLQTLFSWASSSKHSFALLGISNSVGNSNARQLAQLGKFCKNISFPTYTKEDLIDIIEQRVGRTIIEPKAVEFAASRVSVANGDARRVLELTAKAVTNCMELAHAETLKEKKMDLPIVKMLHMMRAVRETVGKKHSDNIIALPQAAKVVLCTAVAVRKASPWKVIRMGELKQYCSEGVRYNIMDAMGLEHFQSLVQQLCDAGLLVMGGNNSPGGDVGQLHADLHHLPLSIGVQLEDVESALETTLGEESFYSNLMEYVRNIH